MYVCMYEYGLFIMSIMYKKQSPDPTPRIFRKVANEERTSTAPAAPRHRHPFSYRTCTRLATARAAA